MNFTLTSSREIRLGRAAEYGVLQKMRSDIPPVLKRDQRRIKLRIGDQRGGFYGKSSDAFRSKLIPQSRDNSSIPTPSETDQCLCTGVALRPSVNAEQRYSSKIASMILAGMLSLDADDGFESETFCQLLRSRISSVIDA